MRTMRRLAAVIAVGLTLTLAGSTGAQAGGKQAATRPHLVRQHDCVRMDQPMSPPITGYLVRDTAGPGRLFYKGNGELTADLLVSRGGTWELRYQCRR